MPAVVAGVATALMWGWIFNPRFGLIDGLLAVVGLRRAGLAARPGLGDAGDDRDRPVERRGQPRRLRRRAGDRARRTCTTRRRSTAPGSGARFRYVTWPALLPVTFYLAIVNAIAASQVFTPSYVLTRGGPDDATLTTALYTFQTAFAYGKLGYGAAMAIVVFVVVLLLTALAFRFVGRRVPYLGADRDVTRRRWRAILAVAVVIPFALPFVWLVDQRLQAARPVLRVAADPPAEPAEPRQPGRRARPARRAPAVRQLDADRGAVRSSRRSPPRRSSGSRSRRCRPAGRGILFGVLVATILIPPTVAIVPQFILFSRLGWVGTYLPLIVPSLFGNAFAIFLFRQWFRNLPPHLFESAELEGANPFQAFRHIAPAAGAPDRRRGRGVRVRRVVERLPRPAGLPPRAGHLHGQPRDGDLPGRPRQRRPLFGGDGPASRSSRRSSCSSLAQRFLVRGVAAGGWRALTMPIRRIRRRCRSPSRRIERRYGLMAETLRFETNDPALLAAADASFGRFPVPVDGREPLVVSLFTEPAPSGRPGDRRVDDPEVVNRTTRQPLRHHGRVARRGRRRRRRRGRGRVRQPGDRPRRPRRSATRSSRAMALSLLPRGRGYLVLHAAGVVRGDRGIVISGTGRRGQVDAGHGLRPSRLRGLRRGRGLRPGPTDHARAVGDALGPAPAARCRGRSSRSWPSSRPRRAAERRDQARGRPRPGPPGAGRPVRGAGADRPAVARRPAGPTRIEPVDGARRRTTRSRSTGRGTAAGPTRTTTPRGAWPAGASTGCT